MNYFLFEGARIAYEDIGHGQPVILVHGTLWHEPWGKFKQFLAKKFRVIVIHLPGYGSSGVVLGKVHDTSLMAQSLCGLVHHLEIPNAPIIALSMGTVVSLKAALTGQVKGKLILVGMPTRTFGVMVILSHILPKLISRNIAKINWVRKKILIASIGMNVGWHKEPINLARKFHTGIDKTSPEAIADVDYVQMVKELPHILSEVTNEKVFLYGQFDVQKTGAKAWGVKYTEIKNAGHDVFSDQPEQMMTLISSRLLPDIH